MIAPNLNSSCSQAEPYYYDFLFGESQENIPESIVNHIKECQHCQEQINQLEDVLSQAKGYIESEDGQASSAVSLMLKLHLAHAGKPVTCKIAKPFLPSMSDPALEIRVPTPITAHLDHCRPCSKDLETIRSLNLNRRQLGRLSQLFAAMPGEDKVSCSQAQAAIFAVVLMHFQETTKEVLEHLCVCPNCRKGLYQYRDDFCKELLDNGRAQEEFPCEQLSSADIFDYAIPYGLDPANDQYAKFRQSLTSHIRICPTCLAKMQQLHLTIYNIIERPESGVVTVYNIDESAETRTAGESDDLYSGFPVRVEVMKREDEAKAEQLTSTINFAAALKQKVSALHLRSLVKTAVAAAAVVMLAFALFFSTRPARALTIDQIYKALENVKSVYISKFVPGETKPTEEKWVSRTLNVYMTKTGNEVVLWDLQNRVRKIKQVGANSVETTLLSGDEIAKTKDRMAGFLGLLPFYDTSEIKDAKWSRVTDDNLGGIAESTKVYDLEWIEKRYDGSLKFKKWRFFVVPKTNLPLRVEGYQRLTGDPEYTLGSIIVVEYLSNSETQTAIKRASF